MLRDHNELSLETLFRLCHDLKKNNKTIAFTHGAFDLFHYSHLSLLRKSAEICDFLIVGVEPDKNITKYKTYKRPIIKEEKRLEIVSELNCVNSAFVIRLPLEDYSYEYLYKELKADFVTIGHHFGFRDKLLERADKVKSKIVELDTDQETTSSIIDEILGKYGRK